MDKDQWKKTRCLIERYGDDEIELPDLMNIISTVTDDPQKTRSLLEKAKEEIVDETDDENVLTINSRIEFDLEEEVVSKNVEKVSCKRCGSSLSTGYYIKFDSMEHGPFGSSCIRKITGRD